jgi:hypothetical protein
MRDRQWAVASVVEARRTKTGGVLALVEWTGVNPASGVAWENSWASLHDLSGAAQPGARALLPRRARRAEWEEMAAMAGATQGAAGRRRSKRLEAERVTRAELDVCYRALMAGVCSAIVSGEVEPPKGFTVARGKRMLRWLSREYATQVEDEVFAARMPEGQAEARWEALPARFAWARAARAKENVRMRMWARMRTVRRTERRSSALAQMGPSQVCGRMGCLRMQR